MDSTVDAMAAAYEALVEAAAAAVREPGRSAALTDLHRCLDAFSESCDRAEGLVQTAAAGLGPAASRHDALCRAVRAVEKDLRAAAAAAGQEEKEMDEEKNRSPTTPLATGDK